LWWIAPAILEKGLVPVGADGALMRRPNGVDITFSTIQARKANAREAIDRQRVTRSLGAVLFRNAFCQTDHRGTFLGRRSFPSGVKPDFLAKCRRKELTDLFLPCTPVSVALYDSGKCTMVLF